VNRIRCLLEFGTAYESDYIARPVSETDTAMLEKLIKTGEPPKVEMRTLLQAGDVRPWNILAITFTNKAANELKERIRGTAAPDADEVHASTFHSACVRFLRRDADKLGFAKSFTIYDSDDSRRVVREIFREMGIDEKLFPVKMALSRISKAKDRMLSPGELGDTLNDSRGEMLVRIYTEYQRRLKAAGAMDFDDLIYNTVRILEQFDELRSFYHRRYRYILVDEYQDTSYAQFRLVRLLTGAGRNICVVGDDDQSIYRFRGATIENILTFEQSFPGANVVRLEQNYRSTGYILNAANELIAKNTGRKGKTLWTDNEQGKAATLFRADSEIQEAEFVAQKILENNRNGVPFSSHAILYRMNAQSKGFENYFLRAGIPHRVYGALRFLDRAEIKDVLAYMSIVDNPADDLRLKRVINTPTRKIGAATIRLIEEIAVGLGISMLEVISQVGSFPALSRAEGSLRRFWELYEALAKSHEDSSLYGFTMDVYRLSGYEEMLLAEGDTGITRIQNIGELLSSVRQFEIEQPEADLGDFLTDMFLASDLDSYDAEADAAVLMTLHNAKGLEYDCVFMPGLEEGIFPSELSRYADEDIEEERRLCYVGITRARKELYLSYAAVRMLFGQTRRNLKSRFLKEIPEDLLEIIGMDSGYSYRSRARKDGSARSEVSLRSLVSTGAPKQADSVRESFEAGDVVVHKTFGRGVVLSAQSLSNDVLLEIDFETKGVKKAMANYAPLKKVT
ncbi:MAG: UvrD-helicase domain-containing protein, partial [Oscillospiraceae bacterium]|nr:UvrD-helicase domain-containing protein [Oscillospiraceae bacterium]